ncbi:MAG: YicC family protein [Bacteroidetes bacterium]|nr:YicC family protein [Bacteroidota bacterium]
MASTTRIQSMTGYGRAEGESQGVAVTVEIRSLNGRYFEADLRLPRYLYELDPELRRLLADKLERGTVTCIFNVDFGRANQSTEEISVNEPLARAYLNKLNELSSSLGLEFKDGFREIIRMPDIIGSPDKRVDDNLRKFIRDMAMQAADHLVQFRCQEGEALRLKLAEAAEEIRQQLGKVEAEEENRRSGLRERIYNNLAEHVKENTADATRFEQELLLYLEKWDIAEEKARLSQHLDYFNQCLEKEPLGRKLNFIAQEMGREMNTLGVKSNHFAMQQAVVLMKEKLEQIKEQVLNLV